MVPDAFWAGVFCGAGEGDQDRDPCVFESDAVFDDDGGGDGGVFIGEILFFAGEDDVIRSSGNRGE